MTNLDSKKTPRRGRPSRRKPSRVERRLLTVPEVAEQLHISTRKAWGLLANGGLRSVRVGARGTRVEVSELDRFIQTLHRYCACGAR